MIKLYADFNNADVHGRLRLNSQGTLDDIRQNAVQLHDGLSIQLYSEDDCDESGNPLTMTVEGVLSYSSEEKCWVAAIDWSEIQTVKRAEPLHNGVNGAIHAHPNLPLQVTSRTA